MSDDSVSADAAAAAAKGAVAVGEALSPTEVDLSLPWFALCGCEECNCTLYIVHLSAQRRVTK